MASNSQKLLVAAVLLAACLATGPRAVLGFTEFWDRNGIINGTLLESMRQFPHHVGIQVQEFNSYLNVNENRYCGGSIITNEWILSTVSCLSSTDSIARYTVHFNRLNISETAPYEAQAYTMQFEGPNRVVSYPRENLALLRLPVAIRFGLDVSPIAIAMNSSEDFSEQFAVLAGIKMNTTQQSYGQFRILPQQECWYPNSVCTLGWKNQPIAPCENVQGGGLVVDWPHRSRLLGVFSTPLSCWATEVSSAHFRISDYLDWIQEVIGLRISNTGYF